MPRVKKEQLVEQIERLTQELVERRFIGYQMSNVLFNLGQRGGREAELFDELRRKWDGIKKVDTDAAC